MVNLETSRSITKLKSVLWGMVICDDHCTATHTEFRFIHACLLTKIYHFSGQEISPFIINTLGLKEKAVAMNKTQYRLVSRAK